MLTCKTSARFVNPTDRSNSWASWTSVRVLESERCAAPRRVRANDLRTPVALVGDINGDGHSDILIGAPDADPNGHSRTGAVFVVFDGPGIGASGSIDLP